MSNVYKKVLAVAAQLRAEKEKNTFWEEFKAWRKDRATEVRALQREVQRSLQHKQSPGWA